MLKRIFYTLFFMMIAMQSYAGNLSEKTYSFFGIELGKDAGSYKLIEEHRDDIQIQAPTEIKEFFNDYRLKANVKNQIYQITAMGELSKEYKCLQVSAFLANEVIKKYPEMRQIGNKNKDFTLANSDMNVLVHIACYANDIYFSASDKTLGVVRFDEFDKFKDIKVNL